MKLKVILAIGIMAVLSTQVLAQSPLWQGKGRIVISSDGNEHDHDDWAATPLSLSLIAAKGLQNKLTLYTYSDHIWGSNQDHPNNHGMSAYEHMKESALGGGKMFGFDNTKFICAVDNAEVAYKAMVDEINKSSESDPLIIVAAGPMQVVGEAINRSDVEKRKYVTVLSHSGWNNRHADASEKKWWDVHTGWTFAEMMKEFEPKKNGGVKFVQILDQNNGKDYVGLNAPIEFFDWIKTSSARNNPLYKKGSWDWLYERIATCKKSKGKNFDPSDAGMIIYLFTGIEKTHPNMAKDIMENPQPKIN